MTQSKAEWSYQFVVIILKLKKDSQIAVVTTKDLNEHKMKTPLSCALLLTPIY